MNIISHAAIFQPRFSFSPNPVRPSHFSSQFTGLKNWRRPLRSEPVEGLYSWFDKLTTNDFLDYFYLMENLGSMMLKSINQYRKSRVTP